MLTVDSVVVCDTLCEFVIMSYMRVRKCSTVLLVETHKMLVKKLVESCQCNQDPDRLILFTLMNLVMKTVSAFRVCVRIYVRGLWRGEVASSGLE